MKTAIIAAAKTLWNYHLMHHELEPSDCILVLGSHDLRVAERAADIYLEGYAPLILFSGGLGNFTKKLWTASEAEKFACIALEKGVPDEDVLIENKSSNTGENILFSRKLLQEKGIPIHRFILVQKPYMERRSYATIKKQWPEPEVRVASPLLSFEDYPNEEMPMDSVINIMVGDLQRIMEYPAKGFQIPQEVPEDVLAAYKELIDAGYHRHLIKE